MKRFHVHVAVEDMPSSIRFYSQLLSMPPSKDREENAKWMLTEPPLNFAISARGHGVGVDHFGFQVDTPEELAEFKSQAEAASGSAVLDQGETACRYAKSEKHWTMDPQGLAWEHFLTRSDALTFGKVKLLECCHVETARNGAVVVYQRRAHTCRNTNCS